jgi:hypothetical protein
MVYMFEKVKALLMNGEVNGKRKEMMRTISTIGLIQHVI